MKKRTVFTMLKGRKMNRQMDFNKLPFDPAGEPDNQVLGVRAPNVWDFAGTHGMMRHNLWRIAPPQGGGWAICRNNKC
jgi:hypothetical protein